eukprot:gene17444-17635_t
MTTRRQSRRAKALAALLLVAAPLAVDGTAMAKGTGVGRWAKPGDPVAARLIDLERTWALLACATGEGRAARAKAFLDGFIAPDFVGTAPDSSIYTRADMTSPAALSAEPEHDCQMISAKVRYFGNDIAVIYGRESATVKGADGKEGPRTLVWTDTLMRRAGKWQAIAVQDMAAASK